MKIPAPVAKKIPLEITQHNETRSDEYAWLRDPQWQTVMQSPETLDTHIRQHLDAENAHTDTRMQDTQELQEQLFEEMKSRIKEDDSSIPCRDGDYYYYDRYDKGAQHPCYYRHDQDQQEQLLLNIDELASHFDYFDIGDCEHSPNHRFLAYSVDTKGSEFYTLHVIDIETQQAITQPIEHIQGNFVWAMDSKTLFYTTLDENHRPDKVYRHTLGTATHDDELIYQETDASFFVGLERTESNRFILINVHNHTTSEIHIINAYQPQQSPICFQPRIADVEYSISDREQTWYINTNKDGAKNFKIMSADLQATSSDDWQDYYCPEAQSLLRGIQLFQNYMVRLERVMGLPKLTVISFDVSQTEEIISFDEPAYELDIEEGFEFDTENLRFSYTSMTTPTQVYDLNMRTQQRQLLKQQQLPCGHQPDDYITQRIFAQAQDGSRIPISLLYKKDLELNGEAPCLLYGYGSYGATMPASFSTTRLSLVNRGFVYAIAHIRGGMELGYDWYTQGKLEHKKNTFEDFILAAQTLIDNNIAAPNNIAIHGGSAGGMLIGAVINMRPDLFNCAVADVPFVDVLNTMSDDSLPLTPPEWPEWGNPIEDQHAYHTIKSYSPYDNVVSQAYPHLLVTAGLTDPRVTYWEPAKWVARLRQHKLGNSELCLKTYMDAGHAGASGRYDSLKEIAFIYAFILQTCSENHAYEYED